MMGWDDDYRRALKNFLLYEGKTPEIEAMLRNVDQILSRLSPRTKKAQGNVEVARHILNQIKKKYRREKAELHELRTEQDE